MNNIFRYEKPYRMLCVQLERLHNEINDSYRGSWLHYYFCIFLKFPNRLYSVLSPKYKYSHTHTRAQQHNRYNLNNKNIPILCTFEIARSLKSIHWPLNFIEFRMKSTDQQTDIKSIKQYSLYSKWKETTLFGAYSSN